MGEPLGVMRGEPPVVDPVPALRVVRVTEVAVDLPSQYPTVTLQEDESPERRVVIPIGMPEGVALAHAWRQVATPRPLTHELFAEVLARLGATIASVRVIGRRAGIYMAEIDISTPQGVEVVGCRPSDAIIMALRQGVPAPLLVDERLFDAEGDV